MDSKKQPQTPESQRLPAVPTPLASSNGEAVAPPKKRRTLSTPLQAMARIEQEMARLTPEQVSVVRTWFVSTYPGGVAGEARGKE